MKLRHVNVAAVKRPHLLLAAVGLLMVSAIADAAVYTVLHHFNGTDGSGGSSMVQGRDGNLYGVASGGGLYGKGVAFRITPTGAYTKLHDFGAQGQCCSEPRSLIFARDGNFYGTTGQGDLFRMTAAGAVSLVYNFAVGSPYATGLVGAPVQGRDGNFYGVTGNGGTFDSGVAYRVTPAGQFTGLGSFPWNPYYVPTPLAMANDGNFYTIVRADAYRFSTAGGMTKFHAFDYGTVGENPQSALVQGIDGFFYGANNEGGPDGRGTLFRLSKQGASSAIYSSPFENNLADFAIQASDGKLYFHRNSAGAYNDALYRVKLDGTGHELLHTFDQLTGAGARTSPVQHTNGKLYGIGYLGGTYGKGVIYSLDVGAPPFIKAVRDSATPGTTIDLLGNMGSGFGAIIGVNFNGVSAAFTKVSTTYATAVVPAGAATGKIGVTKLIASANLSTTNKFYVQPLIRSISPASGPAGSSVVIRGTSLTQTTSVIFCGNKTSIFTVNSDSQITAPVPAGACTGKIRVTTQGGSVLTSNFTVTP